MILFATLFILAAAPPIGDSGSVSSANASYDGNSLVLKGQVELDHGLGKMKAEEAVLQRQEAGKDFPFSLIHLQKDVLLSLRTNSSIVCETADLDFVAMKGRLSSSDKVIYSDAAKKKSEGGLPLKLSSKNIDLQFSKTAEANQKMRYDIDYLTAEGAVQIDYLSQFTVLADKAVFSKNETSKKVCAAPESAGKLCRLVHGSDAIDSEAIELDLIQSQLTMRHPKGAIRSLLNGELFFSSDMLLWDHLKNQVMLRGRVLVKEPSLGTISSDEELHLIHGKKGQLAALRSRGKTTVEYAGRHKLVCHGPLIVDRSKLHASFESPLTQGRVLEGKQVSYEEGEISVLGNKGQIEYALDGDLLHPVSITLKGDVRLFSPNQRKMGLADRLAYSPQTKTFILGANPGKKVLFVNEEENIRISAQEVHITEDPTTKKQSVKGIGTVQLAFSTEEQELMQKMFQFSERLQNP